MSGSNGEGTTNNGKGDGPQLTCSTREYLVKKFAEIDSEGFAAWVQLYKKLRADADRQECDWDFKTTAAMSVSNFAKNRYRDVLPYDHSRVALREGQDYVNACLVPVGNANREYILSQGPLHTTSGDFWQMVWEQNSHLVIMLNKLHEKNQLKCHMYYPVDDDAHRDVTFGRFQVRLESEEQREHYIVRKLVLTKLDGPDVDMPPPPPPERPSSSSSSDTESSACDGDSSQMDSETDEPPTAIGDKSNTDAAVDNQAQSADAEKCDSSPPPPPSPPSSLHLEETAAPETNGDANKADPAAAADSSKQRPAAESRTVMHFQYTMWPDFGVPDNTDVFLEFLEEVRKSGLLDHSLHGPTVVHCSAGIGRSGTFVLVDSVLAMVISNPSLPRESIDIYRVVLDLRKYRMGLIQTYEQLKFSWMAVADALSKPEWEALLSLHCVPPPVEVPPPTPSRCASDPSGGAAAGGVPGGSPKRTFDRLSGNQTCQENSAVARWVSVDGSDLSPTVVAANGTLAGEAKKRACADIDGANSRVDTLRVDDSHPPPAITPPARDTPMATSAAAILLAPNGDDGDGATRGQAPAKPDFAANTSSKTSPLANNSANSNGDDQQQQQMDTTEQNNSTGSRRRAPPAPPSVNWASVAPQHHPSPTLTQSLPKQHNHQQQHNNNRRNTVHDQQSSSITSTTTFTTTNPLPSPSTASSTTTTDKRQLVAGMRARLAESERDRRRAGRLGVWAHRLGLALGWPELDGYMDVALQPAVLVAVVGVVAAAAAAYYHA